MKIQFEHTVDLEEDVDIIQISNSPSGEIVQFYLDDDTIKQSIAPANNGLYNNISFTPGPSLPDPVHYFNIKSLLGLGAYGLYQEKLNNLTFIKVPMV